MVFQLKSILAIFIPLAILFSCSQINENKKADLTNNNIFPIEFAGKKTLVYSKIITPSKELSPFISDTFDIFKFVKKSTDTIFISTLKELPNLSGCYLKDTSIKTITMGKISHRYLDRKRWLYHSEGNCWGNCDYRVCLPPGKSLSFIMGLKQFTDFDSTQFTMHIKIKKGQKTIDSTVNKRLVIAKDHFVDDTTKWAN